MRVLGIYFWIVLAIVWMYSSVSYAGMQDGLYEDAMYYCQRGLERNPDHTYLLKCEAVAQERLEAERRREAFNSIGVGVDNPYTISFCR